MLQTIFGLLCFIALFGAGKTDKIQPNRPFIGILEQDITDDILNVQWSRKHRNLKTYIAASYVKFVEGGGARAVPVW